MHCKAAKKWCRFEFKCFWHKDREVERSKSDIANPLCAFSFYNTKRIYKNTRIHNKRLCHINLPSVAGRPPLQVVFRQRLSSVKGRLLSKVVFRQWSSSIKGHLPSKVTFRQRSPSVKGLLPSKVVFQYTDLWLYSCLGSESSNNKLGRLD